MGLRSCQTSITVSFAATTHANSPTYTTIPPITMPRSPLTLSPLTRKSSITTLPHPPAKDRAGSTGNLTSRQGHRPRHPNSQARAVPAPTNS